MSKLEYMVFGRSLRLVQIRVSIESESLGAKCSYYSSKVFIRHRPDLNLLPFSSREPARSSAKMGDFSRSRCAMLQSLESNGRYPTSSALLKISVGRACHYEFVLGLFAWFRERNAATRFILPQYSCPEASRTRGHRSLTRLGRDRQRCSVRHTMPRAALFDCGMTDKFSRISLHVAGTRRFTLLQRRKTPRLPCYPGSRVTQDERHAWFWSASPG
jgi:hypothetical protein